MYYEKSYLELKNFKIENPDQRKVLPHRESNLLFDKHLLQSKKIKKEGFYSYMLDRLSIIKVLLWDK